MVTVSRPHVQIMCILFSLCNSTWLLGFEVMFCKISSFKLSSKNHADRLHAMYQVGTVDVGTRK
jgi:hypothetical protein